MVMSGWSSYVGFPGAQKYPVSRREVQHRSVPAGKGGACSLPQGCPLSSQWSSKTCVTVRCEATRTMQHSDEASGPCPAGERSQLWLPVQRGQTRQAQHKLYPVVPGPGVTAVLQRWNCWVVRSLCIYLLKSHHTVSHNGHAILLSPQQCIRCRQLYPFGERWVSCTSLWAAAHPGSPCTGHPVSAAR